MHKPFNHENHLHTRWPATARSFGAKFALRMVFFAYKNRRAIQVTRPQSLRPSSRPSSRPLFFSNEPRWIPSIKLQSATKPLSGFKINDRTLGSAVDSWLFEPAINGSIAACSTCMHAAHHLTIWLAVWPVVWLAFWLAFWLAVCMVVWPTIWLAVWPCSSCIEMYQTTGAINLAKRILQCSIALANPLAHSPWADIHCDSVVICSKEIA